MELLIKTNIKDIKIMVLNEIKKLLYKTNPDAKLINIRSGVAYYRTDIPLKKEDGHEYNFPVIHEIPISDMGTVDFYPVMSAKHLIRWITKNEK